MTAAHIGNYGVRRDEAESDKVHVAGLRGERLPGALERDGGREEPRRLPRDAPASSGSMASTRGRSCGTSARRERCGPAFRRRSSTPEKFSRLVLDSPPMIGSDLALAVSPTSRSVFPVDNERFHVAAIDYGMKRNIVRLLNAAGCRVTVFPATAPAEAILAPSPTASFFPTGPATRRAGSADPDDRDLDREEADLRNLPRASAPRTRPRRQDLQAEVRTPRGEPSRGGSADHVGRDHVAEPRVRRGRATLPAEVEPTHRNLNDGTLEGFRHRTLPILAAQFHPEASPGPHDANVLFDTFIEAMEHEGNRRPEDGRR